MFRPKFLRCTGSAVHRVLPLGVAAAVYTALIHQYAGGRTLIPEKTWGRQRVFESRARQLSHVCALAVILPSR